MVKSRKTASADCDLTGGGYIAVPNTGRRFSDPEQKRLGRSGRSGSLMKVVKSLMSCARRACLELPMCYCLCLYM